MTLQTPQRKQKTTSPTTNELQFTVVARSNDVIVPELVVGTAVSSWRGGVGTHDLGYRQAHTPSTKHDFTGLRWDL
jgi:hypothetical protein